MIQKILSIGCLLLAFPSFAQEITSPFYQPELGHILTKTEGLFQKNKWKRTPTQKQYLRELTQDLVVGLGAGFSAQISGEMNWNKHKTPSFSRPHTKAYGAGLVWQVPTEKVQLRFETNYQQTTDVDFSPRRQLGTHIYLGKTLNKMTPYLHLNGQFPLNARPDFNSPIYRAETGVFQNVNKNVTLDSALFASYDKNIKGRSYGIRMEVAYLITSNVAIALNGEWTAKGRAENRSHLYHQQIGTNIRFAF